MMYATLMSSKRANGCLQPRSITRASFALRATAPKALAVLAVLVCTDLRPAAQRPAAQLPAAPLPAAGPSTPLRAGWREAPEYVRLFAPQRQADAYRAYVSPLGLEETLAQISADPAALHPPGAWTPQAMIPYDAFGLTGSYNRWKVAGLYRSRRARVARGPRLDQGQTESWTLIAPFPDDTLQRLEPGTLIIVLRHPSD
jgi:hypothetical protein